MQVRAASTASHRQPAPRATCSWRLPIFAKSSLAAPGAAASQPSSRRPIGDGERQERGGAEREGDGHGPLPAPVEQVRRDADRDERQQQRERRLQQAVDGVLEVRRQVEDTRARQQEGPDVERDLRHGQHATGHDPVVLAPLQRAVGRAQSLGLVRVDEAHALPLGDLGQVRLDVLLEGPAVGERPGQHRTALEPALEVERHLHRRGVALVRLDAHGLERDGLQRLRHLGVDLGRQRGAALPAVGRRAARRGSTPSA